MDEEINMNPKSEQEKIVKTAWIFDVDGVITNPQEKKITEPEILDEVILRLKRGEPVILNTGRSLTWLNEKVISPLREKVKDNAILKNFFVVGEKGGTWIMFDENGGMKYHKDESILVPFSLQEKVRNLINSEFWETMFYDETKETMISTEMKDGYLIEKYARQQKNLSKKIQKLVDDCGLGKQLKIDPTIIAIDIENKYVGKGFAIERILNWLEEKNIKPQKFITFGDGLSDLPMPEKLHEKGINVEFVYVGKNPIKQHYPFPINKPKGLFGKGTLEILKTL